MSKVYITLDSPVGLRKDLLSSNIEIIEMMENLEKLKELRQAKHKTFLFLQAYIKELHSMLVKLRLKFPRVQFTEEEKLEIESEKISLDLSGHVMRTKSFDNLEMELNALKEKLKDVSS